MFVLHVVVSVVEFKGVTAATTSISAFDTTGEGEKPEQKHQNDDEKKLGLDTVEPGFGISSVLSKMGSATKALKQSVESTSIISEFNREQEKFIRENSELKITWDCGVIITFKTICHSRGI